MLATDPAGTGTVRTAQSPIRPVSATGVTTVTGLRCRPIPSPLRTASFWVQQRVVASRRESVGSRRRASSSAGASQPSSAAASASSSRCCWTSTPPRSRPRSRPDRPVRSPEQLTERAAEVSTIGRPASSTRGTAAGGRSSRPPRAWRSAARRRIRRLRTVPVPAEARRRSRSTRWVAATASCRASSARSTRHTHAPAAAWIPRHGPGPRSTVHRRGHWCCHASPSVIAELDQSADHRFGGTDVAPARSLGVTELVPLPGLRPRTWQGRAGRSVDSPQ